MNAAGRQGLRGESALNARGLLHLAEHRGHDRRYAVTHLANWSAVALYGYGPDERREFVRTCAQGVHPRRDPGRTRVRHSPPRRHGRNPDHCPHLVLAGDAHDAPELRRSPGSPRPRRGRLLAAALSAWADEWLPDGACACAGPFALWVGCAASPDIEGLCGSLSSRLDTAPAHLHRPGL